MVVLYATGWTNDRFVATLTNEFLSCGNRGECEATVAAGDVSMCLLHGAHKIAKAFSKPSMRKNIEYRI